MLFLPKSYCSNLKILQAASTVAMFFLKKCKNAFGKENEFRVEKCCEKAQSQLVVVRNYTNYKNSLGFRVGKISR